jgi:hypothetical protein
VSEHTPAEMDSYEVQKSIVRLLKRRFPEKSDDNAWSALSAVLSIAVQLTAGN